MWSYIIDGLLILIVVICAIVGIVKGLFDSVLSLVGTGLALVISVFTAKYVSNLVNKIFNFEDFVLTKLDASNDGSVKFFGGKFSLSNVEVAKFCVWICSVVIMFLIIKLAIYILSKIFEKVTNSSPTISGINRVLGMVFGLVQGAVVVVALLALSSMLVQVPTIGTPMYNAIQSTAITKGIYNYVDEFVEKNLTKEKVQSLIEKIISNNEVPETEGGEEVQNPDVSGELTTPLLNN